MRRCVFVAVVCLAFAACGDSTGPESSAGRYTLVSVDDEPLPFVMRLEGTFTLEITAAHIQLNADGTCSAAGTFRTTVDEVVRTDTDVDACTWTRNNTEIGITSSNGSPTTGSLIDGTMTFLSDGSSDLVGSVFVYRK